MKLLRVDADLATCQRHLASLETPDPEIEAFLTRYLLVLTYAEFAQRIQDVVSERAAKTRDDAVAGFIRFAAARLIRSYEVTELSGFLGRFNDDCKKEFADQVLNTRAHSAYDRIIRGRHDNAHGSGSSMTLREFTAEYAESIAVLDSFAEALGVRRD